MVRSRGASRYELGPPRRRRHPFRTAQLNVVGWSALLGACLVAGALGAVVVASLGMPWGWGALLALVPVVVVTVLDRRRWGGTSTSHDWGASRDEVEAVAFELQSMGVDAQVRSGTVPSDVADDGGPQHWASLEWLERDSRAVDAVLERHGIRRPRF
ncbi:hypothetical protein [Terracoccus luteus]|uniref:Uncharacterized protein n=1 Tax=Terracoccus luteus TaxID=53356 RepID=A0A839PU61_9MICO|nr:hypothetical protein [Terracoccus luteus]MBB2986294.1 hypothetical protein [Terracoccus luteus]MCP2172116.1 hypothetical protein [Terracoccus luteus]